jgi:tetraacyldisaccharide 4'-kinase
VLSVGNLTVGGSAKTPAAAWIASQLRDRGVRTAIASRGHGRRSRSPLVVVSDGRHVHASVRECGDEPLLLAGLAPGVPVVVGRDRSIAGLRAAGVFGCDVLVLDDGFQHHRITRRIDVVLIDAASGFGNRFTLPRGPLREPVAALRVADAIGVVGGALTEADEALVVRLAPHAFRFAAFRRPVSLRPLGGGEPIPLSHLRGRAVGVLSGIARPASLRESVAALGGQIVAERTFADHHVYRPADVGDLAEHAPLWITTEKDALKIPVSWVRRAEVWSLAIALDVPDASALLDWLEARLR